MKIILTIAWRNVWRNPRRSWVLITSIAVGVLGYFGTTGFSRGFLQQMVETTINLHGGHIMITSKGYQENPQIRLFIKEPAEISAALDEIADVNYASLVSLQGMINSSETAAGVMINGIDPERERDITVIERSIVDGRYLNHEESKHEILMGLALAEKLNVELGEKVVLMTTDLDNNISSGAYRIIGLFRTASHDFDKRHVYLNQEQVQSLAGYEDEVTGFTLRLNRGVDMEKKAREIRARLAGNHLDVLTWKDRNPLLVISIDAYNSSIVIIVVILFIAIAFSIANSFLMVIYERIHELGIMMANGVLPKKIRRMLYSEALFITLIGTVAGAAVSAIILGYLGRFGLDLSMVAKGLGIFGVGAVIYPEVAMIDITIGLIVIYAVVFISVLYPSYRASRFVVVDAIRFV